MTRTNYSNNFQTTLTAEVGASETTFNVDSTDGSPNAPFYLVVSVDDPERIEYIRVESKTASSFDVSSTDNRYLDGSADSSSITHPNGAKVRFSPVAQQFDDIHGEIDTHKGSETHDTVQPPQDHASDHQASGSDEISVQGLSGDLADPQDPKTHATSHHSGNSDALGPDDIGAAAKTHSHDDTGDTIQNLDDINDVDTSGVSDGNSLIYDNATSEWVPGMGDDLFTSVADESSLPAAGTQGRLAIARNGDGFFYDDGSQWINLSKVGAMEVIATAGPTNLADTGTLDVQFADVIDYHDLYLEVRGDNTSDTTDETLNMDGPFGVALLRGGAWLTTATGDTLVSLRSEMAVGDTASATFRLSLENSLGGITTPRVRVKASGAVDNVRLRLLGVPNP